MDDIKQSPAAAAVAAVQQPSADLKTEQQPVNPEMDVFAKKEKQYRRMQQQLAQEKQALEAKMRQYETDYMPKSRFNEDPLGALNELGFDSNKLTELLMNAPSYNDPAVKALRAELQSLKDMQSKAQKAAEEQASKQYEQAKKQISNEVKMLVDSNEEFETIKSANMHDAVVELIEQTFQSEGYLMDVSEAAREVENHLVEEAYKMAQLKKVQSRLAPKAPEQIPAAASRPGQPAIKTLNNNLPSQPAKRSSEKERRERALAAFKGQLS